MTVFYVNKLRSNGAIYPVAIAEVEPYKKGFKVIWLKAQYLHMYASKKVFTIGEPSYGIETIQHLLIYTNFAPLMYKVVGKYRATEISNILARSQTYLIMKP